MTAVLGILKPLRELLYGLVVRIGPFGALVLELALVEGPVESGREVAEKVGLRTQFNPLHVGVVDILPLVGIAELLHLVISRRELYLVLQVGAEEVYAELVFPGVVIGRNVIADGTFALEAGRFPYARRAAAEVKVLREAVGGAETGTDIGTENQRWGQFVLDGDARIDGGLAELGRGESAV